MSRVSSSDSDARQGLLWAEHYRVASKRRRARGWHRRDRARSRAGVSRRSRLYAAAVVVFAALTIAAIVYPR